MKSYQSGPGAITCTDIDDIFGLDKNLANPGNRRDMDRLHR
jgi:hypothetical protein